MIEQLSRKQAIEFAKSGVWKEWDDEQIVKFQIFQDRLCIDFDRYHRALCLVLERPVYSHELARMSNLRSEYLGIRKAPTINEIIEMIPEDKRQIIIKEE